MLPLIAMLATSCVMHLQHDTRPLEVQAEFHEIVIRSDAGRVQVVGDPTAQGLSGIADLEWNNREPEVSVSIVAGVLLIDADCPSLASNCSVDLDLVVPPDVAVIVDTGAGALDLRALTGTLDLESGAGDLILADVSGMVFAELGAGDVHGSGIASSTVEVDTGAGQIDLVMIQHFDRVVAETGAGDIDLLVPTGSYDVDADSGSGSVTIQGIVQDDHANAFIQASTGAGSIMITGYTPGAES